VSNIGAFYRQWGVSTECRGQNKKQQKNTKYKTKKGWQDGLLIMLL
jgi:hypothetical protein